VDGYNDDPRFKAKYDVMHPKLAEFMLEAVKVCVAGKKETRKHVDMEQSSQWVSPLTTLFQIKRHFLCPTVYASLATPNAHG
jgi:hypothetical protein